MKEMPCIPLSHQRKSHMKRTEEKRERNIVQSGGEVEEKDKGGQELSTATCKRT